MRRAHSLTPRAIAELEEGRRRIKHRRSTNVGHATEADELLEVAGDKRRPVVGDDAGRRD